MKRIIGIDYGSRRIGVAISDPLRLIATGLEVIPNSPDAVDTIKRLVRTHDVCTIVVGMPYTLKGEKGMKAAEVEGFMEKLGREIGVTLVSWDERFTSKTAHATLLELGVKKKNRRRKETIDLMAASIILQGYLDRRVSA